MVAVKNVEYTKICLTDASATHVSEEHLPLVLSGMQLSVFELITSREAAWSRDG